MPRSARERRKRKGVFSMAKKLKKAKKVAKRKTTKKKTTKRKATKKSRR